MAAPAPAALDTTLTPPGLTLTDHLHDANPTAVLGSPAGDAARAR